MRTMSRSRKVAVIASSRRHCQNRAQTKMGREAQKNKAPRGAFQSSTFGRFPVGTRARHRPTTVRPVAEGPWGSRILPKVAAKRNQKYTSLDYGMQHRPQGG